MWSRFRARIGYWLRYKIADRIDPSGAPRSAAISFTFERHEGVRLRYDGRGCPLWYLGEADYQRAHDEADTRHPRIDWKNLTVHEEGGQRWAQRIVQ